MVCHGEPRFVSAGFVLLWQVRCVMDSSGSVRLGMLGQAWLGSFSNG